MQAANLVHGLTEGLSAAAECKALCIPPRGPTTKGAHPALLRCFSRSAGAKHVAGGTMQRPEQPSCLTLIPPAGAALAAWPTDK